MDHEIEIEIENEIESELLLRFSPGSHTGSIADEGGIGRGNNDTDCTQMAQGRVVSNSLEPTDRHSTETTSDSRLVDSGRRGTMAPQFVLII